MKLSKSEMTKLETLINKAEGTDINVIIQMIKAKQRNEQFKAARSFQVGQTVSFFNTRMGQKIVGQVIKVNTKNIKVKTEDGNWNVTASLLSAA